MKFRFIAHFLLLVALVAPVPLLAQTLAYVDARRLIDEAPQGKAEIKDLEDQFGERNRDLKGRIDEFGLRETELKKNAVLMTSEELKQKTEELRDMQRTLQREQQIYNEDYNRARNQGLARLEKMISDVIIKLAVDKKVDLVVQQAVYASDSIDLTNQVLEELERLHQQ
jgi:outer membrane protein